MTLLWFSRTPSWPNKLVTGFFQAFLLKSSDCLLGVHGYCSGVPRDCKDTLNSTLPSGASFLYVAIAFIASSSSSLCGIRVHPHLLLLAHSRGNSASRTALLRIILWAVLSLGPIETRALKSFLGASCGSNVILVDLTLGRRNALPIWMLSQGNVVPDSWGS